MSAPEQPLVIVTGSFTGRGGARRPLSADEIEFNKAQARAFRLANPALFEGPLPPRTAAEQRAAARRHRRLGFYQLPVWLWTFTMIAVVIAAVVFALQLGRAQ